MGELKRVESIFSSFMNKKQYKKISKIKDKDEKLEVLKNTLLSELNLRKLKLEVRVKKIKDKKIKHILSIKLDIIHSKTRLLRFNFNEKDFKKIDSLLVKLEEEISNA